MRLNISSIMGRKGAFLEVEKELPASLPEAAGPMEVSLRVTNTGDGYLVTGDLSLDVELICSRCLRPVQTAVETSIEEEFFTRSLEDEDPLWEDELLVEGHGIDLASLIEESLLVSIPMKPVCREDCPGLCPSCGALLSEGPCECPDPDIDIRLAPLSKLLQQVSEKTAPERRKDHGSTKEKTFKS